ncbi:MAG: hypothetical protein PUB73_04665 [Bacteroidales bacterium]|nr:hypothetical protein [Bacteroidales bacterium]
MKTKLFFSALAISALVMSVSSCGAPKEVGPKGKSEVFIPLNEPGNRTDMEFFRATASGASPDINAAFTIAELNARNQLAASVATTIKSVTDKYFNQYNINNETAFQQKVEQQIRQVVNQELKSAYVKDSKLYQLENGQYEYWVNIEMSRTALQEPVAEAIEAAISKDEKLSLEFDQFRFKKVFDEEMALEMQKK